MAKPDLRVVKDRELEGVRQRFEEQAALQPGDGGGTYDGMDGRVTRLETHMEYVRRDLDEIKADLKTVVSTTLQLPTKRDLTANTLAGLGIGLAIMALVIGGVIGGLAWIKPDPQPPVPLVIHLTK